MKKRMIRIFAWIILFMLILAVITAVLNLPLWSLVLLVIVPDLINNIKD